VRIAVVQVKIRTEYLPNEGLERYGYANPLGGNFMPRDIQQ
jgi:hypothetical protein